jgi:hypothetical protein
MSVKSLDPTCFLVLSDGCSGAAWLAAVLDKHPLVFCTSGFALGLSVPHPTDKPLVSHGVRTSKLTRKMQQQHIHDIFDMLRAQKANIPVVGDVHGFTVEQYLRNIEEYGLHRPIRLSHLVRHPVTFFERFVFQRQWNYERFESDRPDIDRQSKDIFDNTRLSKFYEWNDSVRMKCFIYCIPLFKSFIRNVYLGRKLFNIQFEKMISDKNYFRLMLEEAIGIRDIDQSYIDESLSMDSVMNTGRIVKRNDNLHMSPVEQFARWSNMEQTLFSVVFRSPEFSKSFAHLDYDFSFLEAYSPTLP